MKHSPDDLELDREMLRRLQAQPEPDDDDIARQVAEDPDAAPLHPPEWWKDADLVVFRRKVPVSIRLDADVVDFFKDQGPGYQSRINAVLRTYMRARQDGDG
ncbi:BrnA antitoxin family protein [Caenispirillum bisanense]|uniref:BrnA antitoxin family protein n=1 Tax=Caenispirillum bisanense TaxID=414052 RepID=UPI0031D8741B